MFPSHLMVLVMVVDPRNMNNKKFTVEPLISRGLWAGGFLWKSSQPL